MPKKRIFYPLRKITVQDEVYIWWTKNFYPPEKRRRILRLNVSYHKNLSWLKVHLIQVDNLPWGHYLSIFVTPRHVALTIAYALQVGWHPKSKGTAFWLTPDHDLRLDDFEITNLGR